MGRLGDWFDFSPAQSKVIVALTVSALVLAVWAFVRTYAVVTTQAEALPVFVGDPDTRFTGVFVLDPNTAPADSLELLPGVGRIIADRIVEYRQQHRFEREIDITGVKGIGARLYDQIRPYLRIQHR
ncbi:MAG: helix-hairpin-helix domain-containing protein [candidate division Zixibacteria bacterium]|nr:helix-hairpin-helix domain-containing protein [candidate division Zixibacteria bacterium]